jgi:hypothetical protein
MCIVTGNTYCQKGLYQNHASTYPTYSNDANMERQCCDKTNGCGNWGANGVPPKSQFECSDQAPDLLSALMTCPFMQNRCASTQTFEKKLADAATNVTISGWNSILTSCTFMITSTDGAPGFNLYSAAKAGSYMIAMWVEYDLRDITPYKTTKWPKPD